MKQLCILRHAEATSPEQAKTDLDRPLTPYGCTQCENRRLDVSTLGFDLILSSPALRTRETARIVFAGHCAVTPQPELYNANLSALLTVIGKTDDSIQSLALVGHNPGVSELAELLTSQPRHLPPASMLIFALSRDWAHVGPQSARLITAALD